MVTKNVVKQQQPRKSKGRGNGCSVLCGKSNKLFSSLATHSLIPMGVVYPAAACSSSPTTGCLVPFLPSSYYAVRRPAYRVQTEAYSFQSGSLPHVVCKQDAVSFFADLCYKAKKSLAGKTFPPLGIRATCKRFCLDSLLQFCWTALNISYTTTKPREWASVCSTPLPVSSVS